MQNLLQLVVFLSMVCVALLSGCQDSHEPSTKKTTLPTNQVAILEVKQSSAHNQVEIMGTVVSVYNAEIAAKVSGTISELPVVLGSQVKKDQLLLSISAGEIDAKLEKSKAQLEQARKNLSRERKLLKKNAATTERVRSYEESFNIALAGYREAQIMQSYTSIRAPFDGRITRKHVNLGSLATPGKPLLQIENETQLQVITNIPEAFLLDVTAGDILPISIPAANLLLDGTVAEVAPTANPLTHSAPVKLDVPPHPSLIPGQFARVSIVKPTAQTIFIPRTAVIQKGQLELLFVATDQTARLRLVKTGASLGEQLEVLSGIQAGEHVIIKGHETLVDGQKIEVINR